jgi:iron complex transport system permease protein
MRPILVRRAFWLLIFFVLVVVAVIVSLGSGEMNIPFSDIFHILSGNGTGIENTVLMQVRLPRIILGLAVGGALSLSGVILQGIFRNPLVEPYTLGISGGASVGVALAIVLQLQQTLGTYVLPLSGFLGSIAVIATVYIISSRGRMVKIQSMLLTGVMISFVASSVMMMLMSLSSAENLHGIVFWIMGSLDEPNAALIRLTVLASLISLVLSYLFVRPLNALRLGEEKAKNLGINTDVSVRLLFLIASVLAGVCVSVAGVIGFVGLIIPLLIRLLVGSDFRILLIASYLLGGAFLVSSDVLARTIISPNELPIGVISGIIGGLLFILIMGRKNTGSSIRL